MSLPKLPLVNDGRCEAERACVAACPNGVFVVERIHPPDFADLGPLNRLKKVIHRRQSAYTPDIEQCNRCGLCIDACPEDAITLVAPFDGNEQ